MQPSGKYFGEPIRADRSFYVRLHLRRDSLSETLSVLQRGTTVSDFGIGTADAPSDYWLELLYYCADSKEMLTRLTALGVARECVRECRETPAKSGWLCARQQSLL